MSPVSPTIVKANHFVPKPIFSFIAMKMGPAGFRHYLYRIFRYVLSVLNVYDNCNIPNKMLTYDNTNDTIFIKGFCT